MLSGEGVELSVGDDQLWGGLRTGVPMEWALCVLLLLALRACRKYGRSRVPKVYLKSILNRAPKAQLLKTQPTGCNSDG